MYTFRGCTMDDEIQESIDRYVEHGIPTGGFLEAVIDNDLAQAISRADERRLRMIPAIVGYLYNETPHSCWGRPGAFEDWLIAKRGFAQPQREKVAK